MVSGPCHLPDPTTQRTWSAPLSAMLNTSVWLGTPNWGEVATEVASGTTAFEGWEGGPVPTVLVAVTVRV